MIYKLKKTLKCITFKPWFLPHLVQQTIQFSTVQSNIYIKVAKYLAWLSAFAIWGSWVLPFVALADAFSIETNVTIIYVRQMFELKPMQSLLSRSTTYSPFVLIIFWLTQSSFSDYGPFLYSALCFSQQKSYPFSEICIHMLRVFLNNVWQKILMWAVTLCKPNRPCNWIRKKYMLGWETGKSRCVWSWPELLVLTTEL